MHFSLFAVAALFSTAMAASCTHSKHNNHDSKHHGVGHGACMSKAEMSAAIDKYAAFISNYTADVAEAFLSDDFVEYSDSIDTLTGNDLGRQTFNKTSFMAGAQAAKNFGAVFTLNVMDVYITTCDSAALSWYSVFKHKPTVTRMLPARGLTIMKFKKNDGNTGDDWQISFLTVEFNSLVWLLNSGGTYSGGRPGSDPDQITVEPGVYPAYDVLNQPSP